MIFLTTLKQKDLSAVSAQQLLKNTTNAPSQINRFNFYEINSNATVTDLIPAITETYIFSNPNKHHLIIEPTPLIHERQLLFLVRRKIPSNLMNKVIQLNTKLGANQVVSITQSDLWALTYPENQVATIDATTVMNEFIISTPLNMAPFAHPKIHDVTWLSATDLNQKLGALHVT